MAGAHLSRQRGMTLVEMLVVLVLAGMITGILSQALRQVLTLQAHFGVELFHSQQGEMYADWFRQSVNGLMPDHRDGKQKFKGTANALSGLTISPLTTATEALMPMEWRLEFDGRAGETQLRYGGGKDATVVLSWKGGAGRFVYYDNVGGVHDSWPPFSGVWPQLPRAIFLETGGRDDSRVIVAVPRALLEPLPRRRDLEN